MAKKAKKQTHGKAKKAAKKNARKAAEVSGVNTKKDKKLLDAVNKTSISGGTWKPEVEGDTIVGELLSLKQEKGKYGEQTVLVIGDDAGARTVYANASLQRELERTGAEVGARIAVQYRGSVKTGRGRPFRLFAVAIG